MKKSEDNVLKGLIDSIKSKFSKSDEEDYEEYEDDNNPSHDITSDHEITSEDLKIAREMSVDLPGSEGSEIDDEEDDFEEETLTLSEKFTQLIHGIKDKISSDKSEDDEEYDEGDEEYDEDEDEGLTLSEKLTDLINNVKEKFQKKQDDSVDGEDSDESDTDEDEDEDEAAAAAKASRTRLIRIALVGAIVWLGIDFYYKAENEKVLKQREAVALSKKKLQDAIRKKKAKMNKKINKKMKEETEVRNKEKIVEKMKEKKEIINKKVVEVERAPELKPAPKEKVAPVAATPNINIEDDEDPLDFQEDSSIVSVSTDNEDEGEVKSDLDKLSKFVTKETDKMEKAVMEEEYIPAPDYLRLGRGLIYNCKDSHWACVDKMNFFKCRDNNKWHKKKGTHPECAVSNSYVSFEDCRVMQEYKVNTSAEVKGCD